MALLSHKRGKVLAKNKATQRQLIALLPLRQLSLDFEILAGIFLLCVESSGGRDGGGRIFSLHLCLVPRRELSTLLNQPDIICVLLLVLNNHFSIVPPLPAKKTSQLDPTSGPLSL